MRFFVFFLFVGTISAQEISSVSGKVISSFEQNQLPLVTISLEGFNIVSKTDAEGNFILKSNHKGELILQLYIDGYRTKRIPIFLEGNDIDLGNILLEKDITLDQADNLITLTDADLSDDTATIENATGLLQATRDVFLTRAAFDFGQAFFRVRGYDSRNGEVLINGIRMNRFFDGRPQWNNWGGLNDVVRNQEFTNGLEASDYTFGGILGNTNINTRPSGLRPGTRMSFSASNRTYAGRIMATHTSRANNSGLGYSISASRRWAESGYIDGTLYDAYSFFGALEYEINPRNTVMATAILAKNRRGRSSAVTQEVFELGGNQYNPYWGDQDGQIRNSRERNIFEPIFMLNHFYNDDKLKVSSGAAFQFGRSTRSRLGYFNAPNPDPTYYRYLPSFYINNPIGADFTNANLASEGFQENSQVNWPNLYAANGNKTNNDKAAYVLYDDVVDGQKLFFNAVANWNVNNELQLDFGVGYQSLTSENYAEIQDLLGAEFHEDIDPFSDTRNNIEGTANKTDGEVFNYNYEIKASKLNGFVQLSSQVGRWNGFISSEIQHSFYQRNGRFQNERFLNNSLGTSEEVIFTSYGVKGGIGHQITGRHWLKANAGILKRPPSLQNTFINPRENNLVVPDIQMETISAVDFSYFLRLPDLTGRLTGFYTRFQNTTDINFFFVDAGVGSDFVQEVITGLDKLHMGIEAGFEYQISPDVKLSLAANVGKYLFASDPQVTINFDTAGQEEPIDPGGAINLGIANIKDYKLAQGPQKAVAFGVEYRSPKYWWVGATANYLANNYASISSITRTPSFLLNPETGARFVDATEENVSNLLRQNALNDFYLLNLVGGKSWLNNGIYVSVFASVNNAFDAVFRTGGYEQSRNGNFGQLQQDNLRNNPTFAPKYWYGYGRTYFLNLAVSF
ncbi:TonB-dependent receptor [Croceivirga thetidis]|uniref:TonB-dependent receptor n=1 Tax=Croceivirga thetidis TaxID=2721623 RepID=A0ABX1GQY5_9FLAO|nr:TonB-dependent receptor [Croceivirga thetidis]NKI31461.1 TonB-dependent receptor [Croceivirga thetidis]